MGLILKFLGTKFGLTAVLMLATFSVTAGWNWFHNYKLKAQYEQEKEQYHQAMLAYANAYDQADKLLQENYEIKDKRRQVTNDAINTVRSIKNDWGSTPIPDIYLASLRDAFKQAASIHHESSTGGPVARLKRAFSRELFGGAKDEP